VEEHSPAGEGVGDPFLVTGKKAWHSVYSVHVPIQNASLLSLLLKYLSKPTKGPIQKTNKKETEQTHTVAAES